MVALDCLSNVVTNDLLGESSTDIALLRANYTSSHMHKSLYYAY